MGRYDKYYKTQDFILGLVQKELMGPVEENEIIVASSTASGPLNSYVTGILWAQRLEFAEGSKEPREINMLQLPVDGEEAPVDNLTDVDDEVSVGAVSNAAIRKPSTMGISCILSLDEKTVKVIFKYANYIHSEEELTYNENKKAIAHKWERKAQTINLEFDFSKEQLRYKPKDSTALEGTEIEVIATNRRKSNDNNRLITFTVTNQIRAQQQDILQNESALFQCELQLIAEKAFLPIEQEFIDEDIEGQVLRMQYRSVKNYAQGHGCAAKAIDPNNPIIINSCFIPVVEVNQMRSLE